MRRRIFFGEGKAAGALQPWLTVDGAPWLTVEDVPWDTTEFEQELGPWLTVSGEPWLTVQQEAWEAIVSGAAPPKYWQNSDVTVDGAVPFAILFKSNPFQPSKQSGDNSFTWLFLSLSWTMGGTIRVRSLVDGKRTQVDLDDGSSIRYVDTTFQLPQVAAGQPRRNGIFQVPLLRVHQAADASELARYALWGQRYQFLIDTPDPLGTGEFFVDGAALEFEPQRLAEYEPVATAVGEA